MAKTDKNLFKGERNMDKKELLEGYLKGLYQNKEAVVLNAVPVKI